MRRTKFELAQELSKFIDFLSFREKGWTIKELTQEHEITSWGADSTPVIKRFIWSRATIFRMLKKIKDTYSGLIIRDEDSVCVGKRGRPVYRYRVNPDVNSWELYHLGLRYRRYVGTYKNSGSPVQVVRLSEEEKRIIQDLKRACNLSERIKKRLN